MKKNPENDRRKAETLRLNCENRFLEDKVKQLEKKQFLFKALIDISTSYVLCMAAMLDEERYKRATAFVAEVKKAL